MAKAKILAGMGSLSNLKTTYKTDLVGAINEAATTGTGSGSIGTNLILEGSSNFNSTTGVTIAHSIGHTNYQVDVIPTQNAEGYLGEVWVTKTTTSFTVYNTGLATTTFDYNVLDTTQTVEVVPVEQDYSTYLSGKDTNGIFTTTEHKRPDGTLYKKSVLSGGTSPQYTTRTITYYEADGITTSVTKMFAISYDIDGDIISEVLS